MIEFPCEKCGTPLEVEDAYAGREANCPHCGAALTIPPAGGAGDEEVAGEPASPAPAWRAGMSDWQAVAAEPALRDVAPPQADAAEPPYLPMGYAPVPADRGKGGWALALGIISMVLWCVPLAALSLAIIGLVLGVKSLQTPSRGSAIAGIVLSVLGLLGGVAALIINIWVIATGRGP